MYKDYRYINAGTNEFYRYGKKTVEKLLAYTVPNAAGYISVPANGEKYWTFGTSVGKFGEFAKIGGTCFSVNKAGYVYAKAGTEKGNLLIAGIKALVATMIEKNASRE